MRTPRPGETALSRAPIPYSVRPQVKHRLRPQRSVNLLQGIMRIAMISKNRVIVVCTPFTVVSRSRLMSLIITFMFEPAKLQMNCASASGISIRRRAGDGPDAVTSSSQGDGFARRAWEGAVRGALGNLCLVGDETARAPLRGRPSTRL